MDGLTPITIQPDRGVQYFAYTCSKCGTDARNTYCEPNRTQMLENRECFHCNYWRQFEANLTKDHTRMTIIGGHVYSPGNRTSGEMRGMSGRRFDIEYTEPSVFAGKRITTFDLWSGSAMPDELQTRFPDTAQFLGGAQKANAGGTTCWNPTTTREEPYPLPRSLGIV